MYSVYYLPIWPYYENRNINISILYFLVFNYLDLKLKIH